MEPVVLRLTTEVRQALHSMLGFLELAVEEPLSEWQRHCLAQCRSSADGLMRSTADIAELSCTEPIPEAKSCFQIAAILAEVAEIEQVRAERKGLSFECRLSPASYTYIEAERGLIQDSLHRVVKNAVQFTAQGHIHVSADVTPEGAGNKLVLEVADTGIGLPEHVLAQVRSPQTELPAAGLSLAIVQQRMAQMNGEMSVVSGEGMGTMVRLDIPIHAVRCDQLSFTRTESGRISPLRLLVVEDSDDGYFVFDGYVRAEGYKLTRAHDGLQAFEMAQCGEFDMIVMDANMPVLDGYAATRMIREWESNTGRAERVPILLFSADDLRRQAQLGGPSGCSGFLTKPASKSEVLRAVNYFARRAE